MLFFNVQLNAQKVNVDVKRTPTPITVDAETDPIWNAVEPVYLEKNMTQDSETPTVTAFWKALYDDDFIYLLINVEDDEHLPAWVVSASAHWEYDMPEVYFDVNNVLNDGLGAKNANDGHWQYAPAFEEDKYDTPYYGGDMGNQVLWCYQLDGANYQVEYAFPYSAMLNNEGTTLDVNDFMNLPEKIGFDVTVIDRDAADQGRKRKVWQNDASGCGEAWACMDECGTITLVEDVATSKNHANIQKTTLAPQIDGQIDNFWINHEANAIEKNFINENPTVDAYWKAAWADTGLFVLVSVTDDDHYPAWESNGNLWEYDWVNLFFDVNQNINDGLGTHDLSGHYESYLDISETGYDTPHLSIPPSASITGGSYAYNVTGNTLFLEYFVPFENLTDNTGTPMSKEIMLSRPAIGFDVNVFDQDEGITTSRQRKVWQNDGSGCGEAWACMDDCGTITLAGEPLISLSENELIFDTLYVGDTQTKTFNISNLALEPLVITSIASNSNAFTATYSTSTINRNKSISVAVHFNPNTDGSYEGQLTIYSNAGDTTINLSGSAIISPISYEVDPGQLEASLFSCTDSTSQLLSISNTGTIDLEYSLSTIYPNSSTPGEVLETINGFLSNPYGMILTDSLIYAINYNWLYIYDFSTMSLLNSYQIHNDARCMAYDGQYLYIGQYGGIVYKYDVGGNLLGELISLPISGYPSLAFDGEHLIVTDRDYHNPTIYKCDLNGNIVTTYTSSFNGYLTSMTWNDEHADGQLWAIDPNYGYIRQLRFEGNQLIQVNSFSRSLSGESSLAFYDNDLWYAANSKLYRMHDGVEEGWLSVDQTAGTIAPGETTTVNVIFDAKKVNSGTYNANLLIASNDPLNPELSIPAQFTLDGEAKMELSATAFDFGEVFIKAIARDTLFIHNPGCDTLFINSISSNQNTFNADTALYVLPGKTAKVFVYFSPLESNNYNGTLELSSSLGNENITVNGAGIPSPEISATPASFELATSLCNDSLSQQLSISNTGDSNLEFNISASHPNSNVPGEVLETINGFLQYPNGMIITDSLVYAIDYNWLYVYDFNTMSLLSSYRIHNNAWGLASDRQYLYIGQYGGIVYKYDVNGNLIGELVSLPISGYPSLAFDGEHLIVANYNSYNPIIYKCDLSGNIVSTYISTFNGYLRNITWNAQHADGQLWAVDSGYRYIRQLRFEGNQLIQVNSFSYSVASSSSLAFYDNDLWYAAGSKLYRMHDGVEEGWLSVDQTAGTLAPGETGTVNVSFDAKRLNSGTYNANLLIASNDPVNPKLSTPAKFTLDGEAKMELSATAIDFGDVFINAIARDTLFIHNPGCDTLLINSISSNHNAFNADTALFVLPGKTAKAFVYFSPLESNNYNGTLELSSSLGNESITVSGIGTPSPEISATPASFELATSLCNDSLTQQLSISNTGNSNLEFNISSNHSNSSTPGEVLETINGFLSYNCGMILTDTLIYAINYDWLYVYDFSTMSLLNSYRIHNNAWGLATDGQYLYIGQYGGIVYKYDVGGNLIGELVSLPISGYLSLAFDGEHLIAANNSSQNPTIYKFDLNGNVVSTYTSTFNGYLTSMTWNDEHADGQLWAIDPNYGYIRQLRFEGNQLINVNSFSRSLSWESSLAFYDNDLWYAAGGKLYRMHDGVEENWLSFDQTTGSIAPGESSNINIGFNANNVANGIFNAEIIISSNDPVNPELSIPAQFTLDGEAKMELSATAIDFGDVFLNDEATNNLIITNSGCDTLFLGNIQQPTGPFTITLDQNMVLPGDISNMVIAFEPSEINSYYEDIYIPFNNSDTLITIMGNGIAAPELVLNTTTFEASLTSGDSIIHELTIQNNGASNLNFTFPTGYGIGKTKSVLIIQDQDSWGINLSTFVLNNFAITPTVINSTQIAVTNFLNFDLIITSGDQNNNYYSTLSAYVDKFSEFVSKGGIVLYQLATQGCNVNIVGNVKVEYNYQESQNKALVPSHLLFNNIESSVLNGYSANHCILSNLPSDAQILTETLNSKKPTTVEYSLGKGLVIASGMPWERLTNSGYDSAPLLYNAIAYTLSKIGGLPYWLELSALSGIVPAGESLLIDVKFNTKEAYAGSYSSSIELTTNDPLHQTETLSFNLTVTGQAKITVADSLIFDYAVIGKISTEMLSITNSGTSVLNISNISCDNPIFTLNTTSLSLEPKQKANLEVSITTIDNSINLANLTINSNAITNPVISVVLKAQGKVDTDSLALVALYNAAGGSNWNNASNWLTGTLDTWYGVTIENGRVTSLELTWNNLSGYLPNEIGDLNALITLNLQGNWGLSNSTIPSSIGNLLNLKKLDLYYGQYTGEIPESLWSLNNLEYIDLGNNQLSGIIPSTIGLFTKLNYFNISSNQITGDIPSEILSLSRLNYLNIRHNNFTQAPMPDFSPLSNLQSLYISGCNFTGSIPATLLNMHNLLYLSISDNLFDAAPMPDFSLLGELRNLEATNCNFTGNLPLNLFTLTQLNSLNLANNQFTGEIPREIGSLVNLQSLFLYSNQLSGSIPAEIANCTNLHYLELGNNQLSGEIPAQLGLLTNLRYLYLYSNRYQHINLEPILGWNNFPNFYDLNYSFQQNVGTEKTVMLTEGSKYTFELEGYTPSINDLYQWYKDGNLIDGANQLSYSIDNLNIINDAFYYCEINNTVTTGLTLRSENITLKVGNMELTGSFNNWGGTPNVPFIQDKNNPDYWHLDYSFNTNTEVKFRFANDNNYEWGGNGFPTDSMIHLGNSINVPSGFFRIELDMADLSYSFSNTDSLALVALYNSAGGGNWNNNANWLSGPLATWEGVTVENYRVTGLDLGWDNNMVGVLPNEIGDLTALQWFYISNNENLTGSIPSSIGNLANLEILWFNNCGLTGTIPAEISGLHSLIDIDLSFNNFDPSSMPNFGSMLNLWYLTLEGCNLTGNIPAELGNCTKLRSVNLANNNLTGNIPESFVAFTFMTECFLNNNDLTGNLADLKKLTRLRTLSVYENKLTFAALASFDNRPTGLTNYTYAPQDTLQGIQQDKFLLTALDCGHIDNTINWYLNGELLLANSQTCEAAETGYYSFRVSNSNYTELTLYSDSVYIEIQTIPVDIPVNDYLLSDGEDDCINALNDITVAGNSDVVIENGAMITFIAGHSIRFLPGFHAQAGSYVDAHITTTGSFCDQIPVPLVAITEPLAQKSNELPEQKVEKETSLQQSMVVYPNPNNGQFTIRLNNFESTTHVIMFNAVGQKVYDVSINEEQHLVDLPNLQRGIYFIKAISNEKQFDQKMVIQ